MSFIYITYMNYNKFKVRSFLIIFHLANIIYFLAATEITKSCQFFNDEKKNKEYNTKQTTN